MKFVNPRLVLVLLCGIAALGGVLFGQDGPLPQRFGVTLAVLAFLSGALFGLRGYAPVYLGIAVYGISRATAYTSPPTGGDSVGAGVLISFTFLPALYAVPALAGVLARRLVSAVLPRLSK